MKIIPSAVEKIAQCYAVNSKANSQKIRKKKQQPEVFLKPLFAICSVVQLKKMLIKIIGNGIHSAWEEGFQWKFKIPIKSGFWTIRSVKQALKDWLLLNPSVFISLKIDSRRSSFSERFKQTVMKWNLPVKSMHSKGKSIPIIFCFGNNFIIVTFEERQSPSIWSYTSDD